MSRIIIGLYQIITGIFGLIIILFSYISKSDIYFENQMVTTQVVTGCLLYILLVIAGLGLMKNSFKAKSTSMVLQFMQIPIVYIGGFIYRFTSAGFLAIGIKNGSFDFAYKLQPIDFTIATNLGNDTVYMVYILPIVFLVLLMRN
jgi:hypothetical protein